MHHDEPLGPSWFHREVRPHPTPLLEAVNSAALTYRLILPIPRILIPPSDLLSPIPSLTDRQYVVDKSRKSASQLSAERELFWYRNALLDMLRASWVEVSPLFFTEQ
jgi:hypothetical protein